MSFYSPREEWENNNHSSFFECDVEGGEFGRPPEADTIPATLHYTVSEGEICAFGLELADGTQLAPTSPLEVTRLWQMICRHLENRL